MLSGWLLFGLRVDVGYFAAVCWAGWCGVKHVLLVRVFGVEAAAATVENRWVEAFDGEFNLIGWVHVDNAAGVVHDEFDLDFTFVFGVIFEILDDFLKFCIYLMCKIAAAYAVYGFGYCVKICHWFAFGWGGRLSARFG